MEKDIKILVVDDSVTERQILSKIVSNIRHVELVGIAPNGKIALSKIELKQPDVVLLDVIMPEMDGLETLAQIKKKYPHIDVIMLSGMDKETANITMRALESGALDFIPKPRGVSVENNMENLRTTLTRLVPMARARKYSRQARGISRPERPERVFKSDPELLKDSEPVLVRTLPLSKTEKTGTEKKKKSSFKPGPAKIANENQPSRKAGKIDVVAIGVSTGGPNALQEIIPKLNNSFPVPILVVQHMPVMFTASLAARLDSLSAITVVEGKEGQRVEKGVMYIAPGGRHMVVRKNKFSHILLGLVDSPPVNSCRPSVDVLFRSVAMTYGGNVLTAILTGMGNDGVSGVAAIRRKGGYSIVQDEKTSLIWGMPGSVVAADQADAIVPIDNMASNIMKIVSR